MDTSIASLGTPSPLPKARRFSRNPVLFASIEWGKDSNGFILNAGEGGLCVQASKEIAANGPLDLRFQSVRSGAWVKARGRIAWRSEDRTIAGIEFVDATPEVVGEVRRWLSFGASLEELQQDWGGNTAAIESSPPGNLARSRDLKSPVDAGTRGSGFPEALDGDADSSPLSTSESFLHDSERSGPSSRISLVLAVSVAALLILSIIIYAGRRGGFAQVLARFSKKEVPATELLAPAEVAGEKELVARPPAAPETNSAKGKAGLLPPLDSVPLGSSGFVLQVAAMSDQGNADKLAQSLRLKNFPAFVSKRSTDRFYRVLIGPYENQKPLRETKRALGDQNIQAIERRWSH